MRFYQKKLFSVLLAIVGASLSAEESGEQRDKVYAKVRAHLMLEFTAIDDTERSSAAWIKQNLGASDEQIRKAMMDIHREAVLTHSNAPEQDSRSLSRMRLEGAIRELWGCADSQTKDFLLDYAASRENDAQIRSLAVSSYLRVADAEEARDILLRFLVGENQMDLGGRSSICRHAQTAFMDADAAKRTAILESLYVALSREENKCNFHVYDDILSELSSDYVHSHQRLAILEKLIDAPPLCKADEFVMPNLTKKLKELQKTKRTTNINTNLSALKERDFNQPLPEEERFALEMPPDAPDAGGTDQEEPAETRCKGVYPLAAVAGLLAVTALWFVFRRKRGSV